MPLANILAPQLLRKAQDIEDQLGPAQPKSSMGGYLQVGYEKTPYDPKGLVNKPESKSFDGRFSPGMVGLGQMQRSGDPGMQAFARGMIDGGSGDMPVSKSYLIPTAPAAPAKLVKKGEPAGTKGRVLKLPEGPAGMNERGQAVTVKQGVRGTGNLGYLAEPGLVTPYGGSEQLRTGERRPGDVSVSRHEGSNKFTGDVLQRQYGGHLREYEDNRGEFPKGYFDGMSKAKKESIIDAVKELQRRNKIAAEGTST